MAKKATIDVGVNAEPVKNLRQELREAVKEAQSLASAEIVDQKALEAAVLKTAELKDQIADVNEQIAVFATGSKYEAVSNSLGQIGGALKNLDFGKAQERAGAFATAAGKITFKDAITSVKQLGSTFLTIGKSLLTNPLFLLGTIIALIVKSVYEWLDSMGFIQKALDIIMWPLNKLIEGLKALGDWLGITSYAAEEAAEKKAAAFEKAAKAQELANKGIIQGLDNEIRMAKLAGEETTALERQKLLEIRKTAKARYEADLAAYEAGLKNKDLTQEEIAALKEKAIVSRLAANQSYEDIKFFDAKTKKDKDDKKKKDDEDAQKDADKAKADRQKAYQDRLKEQKEFDAARLKAQRDIEDLQNAAIKDDTERAVAENKTKYERIIADTLANEKLLKDEKDKLIALFQQEQQAKEDLIRTEANKKRQEQEIQAQQEYNDLLLSLNENTFIQEKAAIESQSQERLNLLNKQLQDGLITQEQFDAASIALEAEKQRKLNELKGGEEGMTAIEKAQMEADALRNVEKQRLEAGIIDYEEYAARIAQIDENLANKLKEEDDKVRQQRLDTFNAGIDAASGAFGAIASLSEAVNETQIANAEGNEAKQEELRKKGFEQSKKFQIAQATIAGIQGVINALTAQSTIPEPFGSILKGVNAGIVAVTTAANIAKIKATKYQGGGGGGAPSTSAGSSSVPSRALPNVSFQGNGGAQNNVSAGGSQPMEITLNNTVAVSATEVEQVQQTNAMLANNAQI
jgi:hypothetical protein